MVTKVDPGLRFVWHDIQQAFDADIRLEPAPEGNTRATLVVEAPGWRIVAEGLRSSPRQGSPDSMPFARLLPASRPMFDLRYHVASLAAVFVALLIGILVGVAMSGKVDDAEKQSLQSDVNRLEAQLDAASERRVTDTREQKAFRGSSRTRTRPSLPIAWSASASRSPSWGRWTRRCVAPSSARSRTRARGRAHPSAESAGGRSDSDRESWTATSPGTAMRGSRSSAASWPASSWTAARRRPGTRSRR